VWANHTQSEALKPIYRTGSGSTSLVNLVEMTREVETEIAALGSGIPASDPSA
jgi:hypothetical protein